MTKYHLIIPINMNSLCFQYLQLLLGSPQRLSTLSRNLMKNLDIYSLVNMFHFVKSTLDKIFFFLYFSGLAMVPVTSSQYDCNAQ